MCLMVCSMRCLTENLDSCVCDLGCNVPNGCVFLLIVGSEEVPKWW